MGTTARIEVFLRAAPESLLRRWIALAAIERWNLDDNVSLRVMSMAGTPIVQEKLPRHDFHWETRRWAEKHARREFYILTDDDHLILGERWAERAWEQMAAHPKMGLMSGRSMIAPERLSMAASVGCPCIIRKGVLDFSKLSGPANRQDEEVCAAVLRAGYCVGYLEGCDYIHCGFGLSQVEPKLWLRY